MSVLLHVLYLSYKGIARWFSGHMAYFIDTTASEALFPQGYLLDVGNTHQIMTINSVDRLTYYYLCDKEVELSKQFYELIEKSSSGLVPNSLPHQKSIDLKEPANNEGLTSTENFESLKNLIAVDATSPI